MEFKELNDGVKIPVLGIGTWKIGGGFRKDTSHDKRARSTIFRTSASLTG